MACQRLFTPERRADRAEELALDLASAPDIPSLAELDRRCFGMRCWSRAAWAEAVCDPVCTTVVVRLAGTIIGAMVLILERPDASLASIAVDAHHRRRGIGSRLLADAMSRARAARVRWLTLEVDAGSAAISLYRRAGFAVTARFREDRRERLKMVRRLGGHDGR